MTASRCIMVIGVPRSGTSATAGLLHHAGIPMERARRKPHPSNPKGYFEDVRWLRAHQWSGTNYVIRRTQPSKADLSRYKRLASVYQSDRLWGMKQPRLCAAAQYVWPLLDEVRIVALHRDLDASIRSLAARNKMMHNKILPTRKARAVIAQWLEMMEETLAVWNGPLFHLQFEDLVQNPTEHAIRLCRFAAEGLDVTLTPSLGAEFIDPALNRHGRQE